MGIRWILAADISLHFAEIPNVHWPETMATFDAMTATLMSCDGLRQLRAVEESPTTTSFR
jgi:flavorubredoxin